LHSIWVKHSNTFFSSLFKNILYLGMIVTFLRGSSPTLSVETCGLLRNSI